MTPLPIDALMPALLEALGRENCLVLVAPPGAGKTTRVPPALLGKKLAQRMVMLQPRRIAARAAARRIATEQGFTLGDEVGYQVRFDRHLTKETAIQIVTEGILTRRLQRDPYLEGVDAVLLDEFHLRSIHSDLALSMVREVQRTVRPELKLIVMSATLDAEPIAAFLGDCPVLRSEGKLFEMEIDYLPRRDDSPLPDQVRRAVKDALRKHHEGHVLVFLPGVGEINRAKDALEDLTGVEVLPLHGRLPADAQDRAIERGDRRKVILATNVAETSLTIDGVRVVIDSGLLRLPVFDPSTGLDQLDLARVSVDAADQRAGRSARTGPGSVYRLWTRTQQRALSEHTTAEIQRTELASVVLELGVWGKSVDGFDWLDAPSSAPIARAKSLLRRLCAIDPSDKLTPLGRAIASLPVHPRLGCLLHEAHRRGLLAVGAAMAALISERSIARPRPRHDRKAKTSAQSDLLEQVDLLDELDNANFRPSHPAAREANVNAARAVARIKRQLYRLAEQAWGKSAASTADDDRSALRLLLAAYPDRVVRRRQPGSPRGLMVGQKGVILDEGSVVLDDEFFIAVDIDGKGREAKVRSASAIDPQWLQQHEIEETSFDSDAGRVRAVTKVMFEDLCLSERASTPEPRAAAETLATAAALDLRQALHIEAHTEQWLVRVGCLRRWMPEINLPAMDDAALAARLPELCTGLTSFAELQKLDLLGWLSGSLTHEQRTSLSRLAPERLTVPSGEQIRLRYEADGPPVLAVKLQKMFGLADTPTVAGGKIKVVLHLLAPNQRPAQVTQDLRSFWNQTYAEVRKELRRRYPKHDWPDDPWSASPEKRRPPRGNRR